MNAHHEEIPFVLPTPSSGAGWIALVDTSCQTTRQPDAFYSGGIPYPLQPRSLALLVERASGQIRSADRRRRSLV
jgi:glycogen operon protein